MTMPATQPTTDDVERAREPGLTPRLRALSIANQHASLFTSAGGREQVMKSIEDHITAAVSAIIVRAEVQGVWVEIIREHRDGPFSHIIEDNGIRAAYRRLGNG